MPTDQIIWTPASIFDATKRALVECLALDDEEVVLDANIFRNLGAESIDVLDITFRMNQNGISRIDTGKLRPTLMNSLDNNERATPLDASDLLQVATQFEGINTSHLKPGCLVEDLFTVRFLCEVAAKHMGVTWEEKSVPI